LRTIARASAFGRLAAEEDFGQSIGALGNVLAENRSERSRTAMIRMERDRHSDCTAAASMTTPASRSDIPITIQRALSLIEHRYTDRLTLAAVARAVERNRPTFARLFRRATGQTIHQYVARVRVNNAARLIKEGQKVEAVMLQVGYRSKKNFYRQFRVLTGLTPGAYRRVA
jgi:AraC-like DNA-binding protein